MDNQTFVIVESICLIVLDTCQVLIQWELVYRQLRCSIPQTMVTRGRGLLDPRNPVPSEKHGEKDVNVLLPS